jgi:branched-chain amino acid transport system substrate-binding protein
MEDLTGRQFGSYQITAPLGEGGMAAVYKAYHPAMDRYVALKVLPRHFASDPQFVTRFQQEARVLAQLQHPHILPVFDFGEADGYTYIVMPFVKSGTLTDLLKGQSLSLPQIRTLVAQIGGALEYAHARGLIHRDVKPSNVLIDETGNCLLTDFGLAKIMEGSIHLTTSGAVMGTPAYMSPEQGLGQKIDKRSDIYALGVILYEMATGRTPYTAETPMAVVIKHINDPLPPPHTIKPDLPDALERVILKSLAKNPDDRFASAGEMVRAIQAAIPETTIAAAPATEAALPAAPPAPAPRTEPLAPETVRAAPPEGRTEQAAPAGPAAAETVKPVAPPVAAPTRVAPAPKPLWQAVLITALGAILGVLLALPFAAGFLPLGSAIGGAVVGLSVGLAWRRVEPPVSRGRVLALVGLWALSGGVAVVTGPGLFLVGGLLTGWVLRRAQPATMRRDVVIIGLGWVLSWLLGGVVFAGATRLPSGPASAVLAAFGVALAGALSGWITFGRLRAARARTLAPVPGERPAPKFKWPVWAVVAVGLVLLACAGVLVVLAVTTIRKTTADRAATQTAAAVITAPTDTARPRSTATSATAAAFECADAIGCVDIAPGEPIHLAWIQAMSGGTAPLGIDNVRGIEIALDDHGGGWPGHPILLTGEDSLCTPEGGEAAASKIAADSTVVAVIGTSCSSEARAAMPILSEAGLVMVSPSNTDAELTDPNSEHHWPGYLRTVPSDLLQGRVAADFAFNQLGVTKAATLHDDSPYAEGLQQIFADAFRELGGEITAQEAVDRDATDMRAVLRQIASGAPGLIFFPIYEPAGDYIAAQKCEVSGLKNAISMSADALFTNAMPQAAGRCANGMYLTAPYVRGPGYEEFVAKYTAKYGEAPISGYHAFAYDAANMVLAAIEAVAVQDPDGTLHIGRQALRDALYATKDFAGLTGALTCNANGDCAASEVIAVYQITEAEVTSGQWPPETIWWPEAPDIAQPTRAPATRAPQPPPATATAAGAEATNWRVDFSYRFPDNYWSVGTHQYTLVSNCPGLPPEDSNTWTHSFDVSDGAAVLAGDVYLRLSGLRHEGAEVSAIHPSQSTVAQLSWAEMTRSEAEQYAAACAVTVSWDGGAPVTLTAGAPYQL